MPEPSSPTRSTAELIATAAAPEAALPLPALRNFCSGCGAPWQPQWADCPVCASRQNAAHLANQPERSPVAPSLGLYFTLLAASAVGLVFGIAHAGGVSVLIGVTLAHCVIITGWTIWAWPDVFKALLRPFSIGWTVAAPFMAVVTFGIATGAIHFLHQTIGLRELRMSDPLVAAGYGWPLIILLVCVQPAVFEELAFRGVVLPSLQPTLAAPEAIIVSALLFMTLHLTIASFPHLFLIGLALGYLRVRTGSLVPGMLMHFTHNLLCVLAERHWW